MMYDLEESAAVRSLSSSNLNVDFTIAEEEDITGVDESSDDSSDDPGQV